MLTPQTRQLDTPPKTVEGLSAPPIGKCHKDGGIVFFVADKEGSGDEYISRSDTSKQILPLFPRDYTETKWSPSVIAPENRMMHRRGEGRTDKTSMQPRGD